MTTTAASTPTRSLTPAEIAQRRLARAQQRVAPAAIPLPPEHAEPVPLYAASSPRLKLKAPSRTRVIHTKLSDAYGWRLDRLTLHLRQTTRRRSGDNVTIEHAIEALEEKLGLPPLTP